MAVSDSEKGVHAEPTVQDRHDDSSVAFDSDANSDFQVGVERVRAVTTIWSKPTLIAMFSL